MRFLPRRSLTILALLVFLPLPAAAQGLTGSLVGTVADPQGAVLPATTVRVASPALIGGELRTTTSERGQWRFPVLPPGTYTLTVERPDFETYREGAIGIGAGATLERAVVLGLAGVTQALTVEASSIEARSSGLETRFDSDYLANIPTRRFSMFDLIRSTPGVSPTSPSSGTVNSVSAFGSGVNENMFLIDGTNFTCPCQGVSRAEPNVDVIREVHVQSMGASVEYGNLQGAVFNVVTKQGGDRFQSDASYYGQFSGLTSQPVVLPVSKGTVTSSGYERDRYRDATASVGGPAVRDRLWFYGAYQYLRDFDSQPGVDPASPRTYQQDKYFGKLTWKLPHAIQLMQSYHQENWVNPTPPTLSTPFEATNRVHARVPSATFGNVTQVLSGNTYWEARVGRFQVDQASDPSTGDRTTSNHTDRVTGLSSGNAPQFDTFLLDRITAKALLHRYQSGWLGGDHELKMGTQVEDGNHYGVTTLASGVRYVDNNTAPFQAIYRTPSISGGEFVTAALFASDAFTLKRVTINAGLRYDHTRAISQDLPGLDANGNETDGTIQGLGTLYTWNMLSPRAGVTAKLTADGRTVFRASYGRFNQGVLTGELAPFHPGVTPTTTMQYDAATGGYTTLVSTVDPKRNLALDPHTRTPRNDEYSLGLDREVARGMVAAVAYVRKRGDNYIAWTDTTGQYRQETRTLPDSTTLPVYVLTTPPSARLFLLTNPGDYFVNYDGLVLSMQRRMANGWQASGSYTYSQARGLLVSSAATADGAQLSTVAPNNTFGRDPNNLTNAEGRLPNDRPHVFRATGVYQVPRVDMTVAANLQIFSGKPWASTTPVSLPQGDQRILLEPLGSQRLPTQSLLDLRVSKTLTFGQTSRIDLLFDVLNVLDESANEAIATDNRFSPTYGTPTIYVDPRRAMVGIRVSFGR